MSTCQAVYSVLVIMAKMWLNQLHNTIVEVGDILPVAGADGL